MYTHTHTHTPRQTDSLCGFAQFISGGRARICRCGCRDVAAVRVTAVQLKSQSILAHSQ